jgi:hypothetical protein
MTALRGSYLCGEVRFEIDGPLMRSSHCLGMGQLLASVGFAALR